MGSARANSKTGQVNGNSNRRWICTGIKAHKWRHWNLYLHGPHSSEKVPTATEEGNLFGAHLCLELMGYLSAELGSCRQENREAKHQWNTGQGSRQPVVPALSLVPGWRAVRGLDSQPRSLPAILFFSSCIGRSTLCVLGICYQLAGVFWTVSFILT